LAYTCHGYFIGPSPAANGTFEVPRRVRNDALPEITEKAKELVR
jgi:hypothetical protein